MEHLMHLVRNDHGEWQVLTVLLSQPPNFYWMWVREAWRHLVT